MVNTKYIKGFTLIELLVVISIIGLLSSIVLATLNTTRVRASDTVVKADLRGVISSAEIVYSNLGNSYNNTDTLIDVSCTISSCPNTSGTILQDKNIQNAIKHILVNNGGQPVSISISKDGKTYSITTPITNGTAVASIDNTSSNVISGNLLAAPTNFTLSLVTNGLTRLLITFNDSSNLNMTVRYVLEYSTLSANGPFVVFDDFTHNNTQPYSFSKLYLTFNAYEGDIFYYRLRALNGNLYSPYVTGTAGRHP